MKPRLTLPLLALSLVLTVPAYAQAPYATPEPAPAAHDDTPDEGIGVSGEWTIIVHEPDGTLAEKHTFHNAIGLQGVNLLAEMISGELLTGYWVVDVGSPCLDANGDPAPCHMLELSPSTAGWESGVGSPIFNGIGFEALTVSVETGVFTATSKNLLLRGTFAPNNVATANITEVQTRTIACSAINRGEDCISDTGARPNPSDALVLFTGKVLDAPVSVEAGQSITVEVRIAFTNSTEEGLRSEADRASLN